MGTKLTVWILAALAAGMAVGLFAHAGLAAPQIEQLVYYLSIVTDLFLRLIKMIIAPLVLATLMVGIAGMGGDTKALGRIGSRAVAWFIVASVVSLTLGLVMVNTLQPGVGLNLPLPPADANAAPDVAFDLKKFIIELAPKSIIDSMATNNILQIVVFSVFAGVALAAIGERGKPLVRGLEAVMDMMLTVTGYVMWFAPAAVFAAVASTVAKQGFGILVTYGAFMGGFYLALAVLWAILLAAGGSIIGFNRIPRLLRDVRDAVLVSFSTASSEAAFPRLLGGLERFGVPNRIASFTLPLGYSFNLDGSMMYCAFAVVFIAQAYGIDLTFAQEVTMLLLLMVTSKGIASVPRASLVVIAATLDFFNLPEGGLLLILAVDHFLDMGRSATNAVGNAVATAVVAKWEGALADPADPVADTAKLS